MSSWNYGFDYTTRASTTTLRPDIVEYHDRRIVAEGTEHRLADFIAAHLARLSEVDLVAIDTLMRDEETTIGSMRIKRVV